MKIRPIYNRNVDGPTQQQLILKGAFVVRFITRTAATKPVVVTVIALSVLVVLMVTGCAGKPSPSGAENHKANTAKAKKSDMWIGETTVTVDGITVKVDALRQKDAYPDRLPEIVTTNPGPDKDAIMQWFSPLQAVEDTNAKPSIFYAEDSQWFLVDKKGNKKGKLSIDKFDGIYYRRIGPDKNPGPMFFEYGDAEPMAKDFIKNHGGVPDEKLTLTNQGFREATPSTPNKMVWLQRGYGHRFKGIDIWDDTIEVGMTKLPGAYYYRRWHEFKAEGDDKILLGPAESQVIAEQVVRACKKDRQAQLSKFNEILTGKKPLQISLQQLVYFDPRPRDSRHFYDTQIVYHPGWIARVNIIEQRPAYTCVDENDTTDRTGGVKPTQTTLVDTPLDIGIPSLIIDAINGHVYERKPKGDNLFK